VLGSKIRFGRRSAEHVGTQVLASDCRVCGPFDFGSQLPARLLMAEGDHVESRRPATRLGGNFGNHGTFHGGSAAERFDVVDELHACNHYRFGYDVSIPFREFTNTVTRATIAGMDAKAARTMNIRRWVEDAGGPAAFARRYGGEKWVQAQVSQWISATNPKPIGHALAREIETVLGKQDGSMDRAPDSQVLGLDLDKLGSALKFLEDLFANRKKAWVASQNTILIWAIYSALLEESVPNWVNLAERFGNLIGGKKHERQGKTGSAGQDDRDAPRKRAARKA